VSPGRRKHVRAVRRDRPANMASGVWIQPLLSRALTAAYVAKKPPILNRERAFPYLKKSSLEPLLSRCM
jgi:hypothetical protein